MGLLRRGDVVPAQLSTDEYEDVTIPSLGGEVRVRGLLLTDQLYMALPREEPSERFAAVTYALEQCVTDIDGLPFMSAEEWDAFGKRHFAECMTVYRVIRKLSGLSVGSADEPEVEEKKTDD